MDQHRRPQCGVSCVPVRAQLNSSTSCFTYFRPLRVYPLGRLSLPRHPRLVRLALVVS